MITPSERVLQAVEENFMVLHNVLPDHAYAAVRDALEELQTTLGYCPTCWGRGYDVTHQATDQKVYYCHCERGRILKELNDADSLAHRPQ